MSQEGQTPQNQHPGLSDVLRASVSPFPSLATNDGNILLETESCEPSSGTVANPQPRDQNTHPQIPFPMQRDHRAASFLCTPRNPEPFPKAIWDQPYADDPQRTEEERGALHGPPRTAAPPRAGHLPLPAAEQLPSPKKTSATGLSNTQNSPGSSRRARQPVLFQVRPTFCGSRQASSPLASLVPDI